MSASSYARLGAAGGDSDVGFAAGTPPLQASHSGVTAQHSAGFAGAAERAAHATRDAAPAGSLGAGSGPVSSDGGGGDAGSLAVGSSVVVTADAGAHGSAPPPAQPQGPTLLAGRRSATPARREGAWPRRVVCTTRLLVAAALAAAIVVAVVLMGAMLTHSAAHAQPSTAATVQAAVNATGCSTLVVAGLSVQLVTATNQLALDAGYSTGMFASLSGVAGVALGDAAAAVPYLQTPATAALVAAVEERRGDDAGAVMHINSALRTIVQQLLLYRWYKLGECGITLAAKPGHSNHNSGLAVDIEDAYAWQTAMEHHGWQKLGDFDRMHYDYVGAGGNDVRSISVLAFQKLWNCNLAPAPASLAAASPARAASRAAAAAGTGSLRSATAEGHHAVMRGAEGLQSLTAAHGRALVPALSGTRLAEDGVYGPATEAALLASPVDGFATPLSRCGGQ